MLEKFKNIKCFIFDVDGVLTDGTLGLQEDGQWLRRMHIRDGYALQLVVKKGYSVLVLSGSHKSDAVIKRLQKLGVAEVYMDVKDKVEFIKNFLSKKNIKSHQVLYMGDDIPDLPALQFAGLSCCPADAATEVKAIAQYISPVNGGMGCVRDVIEKVLKLNSHWDNDENVASV